ncbi:MAG: 4,5-DOPA dioxygenase extradiol [Betaproteobacteria bacterium HGW-Betaproteobacteria-16]|nr:MAG: 4,5-DOPA dioxygenase extradiol [Betaproteobacteria bacterium HGW-Betaproteobacteria-16]
MLTHTSSPSIQPTLVSAAAVDHLTTLSPTERMPVLFIGHGSPMNAIEDNAYRRSWQALGERLMARPARPRLILCVSAHWLTRGWQLTAMADPRTIHDFGGFPQALFDQQYPAPGDPAAAQVISDLVRQPGSDAPLGLDGFEWGLDHGAWSVLKPMFPDASIPVIQLGMDYSRPPAEHAAVGRQLRALRDRGVLIVGSGNIVHNLRAMRRGIGPDQAYDWAIEFDQLTTGHLNQGNLDALSDFQRNATLAANAHPTWEHYLPLLYAAGAVFEDEAPAYFNDVFDMASLSMRSVVWGG